jgi:hypothetical protein
MSTREMTSMKIYDIIHKFTDSGLWYEVVENGSYASFGFFKQDELISSRFYEKSFVKINFQYVDGKRLVVFYIWDC